jgi:hypothetical protein
MGVRCQCYYTLKSKPTVWVAGADGEADLAATEHAEMQAYKRTFTGLGKKGKAMVDLSKVEAVLLVLNEFPCEECKAFLKGVTKNGTVHVIVGVTSESENTYAGNWGFKKVFASVAAKQKIKLPQVIYLYKGRSFYPGYVETTVVDETKKKGKANQAWEVVRTERTVSRMDGLLSAINREALARPADFPDHPSLKGYVS